MSHRRRSLPAWLDALTFRTWPKSIRTPLLLCWLTSCGITLITLILIFTLPPVIPLWYSLATLNQQLAPREWLLVLPALSFAITFMHWLMLEWYKDYTLLVNKLLIWMGVWLQGMLALALIRILFLTL
jgi:hypothetical protein